MRVRVSRAEIEAVGCGVDKADLQRVVVRCALGRLLSNAVVPRNSVRKTADRARRVVQCRVRGELREVCVNRAGQTAVAIVVRRESRRNRTSKTSGVTRGGYEVAVIPARQPVTQRAHISSLQNHAAGKGALNIRVEVL